jgi:hypothetical protein
MAYSKWLDPATRSKLIIDSFIDAEKVFKEAYRQLYMGYLKNNPNVTDTDLEAMGLPKRTSRRKPSPVPTTFPDAVLDTSMPRRIIIHFHDEGKITRAKPKGVHGAEIKWVVSDIPVKDIRKLVNSSFDTCSPFTLEFNDDERGMHLYLALRWENTRGEKGPFGEIITAIIP